MLVDFCFLALWKYPINPNDRKIPTASEDELPVGCLNYFPLSSKLFGITLGCMRPMSQQPVLGPGDLDQTFAGSSGIWWAGGKAIAKKC